MKKASSNIIVSKKAINAAAKGIAASVNNAKKNLDQERKSLYQTINFLCAASTPDALDFQNFFKLKKTSTRENKKAAQTYIMTHLAHTVEIVTITCPGELDEVEATSKIEPATSTGKPAKDYLPVICEIVKRQRTATAKLREIGKQMREQWGKKATGEDTLRFALALKNTFREAIAEQQQGTKHHGAIYIRK